MKDWEIYERQIFDKLQDEFPGSRIKKNQRIVGKYSLRSRQIDILVTSQSIGQELIIVIDCKKFGKKIDLKTVESFIGFCEDVGAHLGILITNVGYSQGANNRVKTYHRDIKLDIVKFIELEDYSFNIDFCRFCKTDDGLPRGIIEWGSPFRLDNNGITTIINEGNCSTCDALYIKCQGCGEILSFGDDYKDIQCMCGIVFGVSKTYVGSGLTEKKLVLNGNEDRPILNNDPDQKKIFD
jgi:hypothetical protein